MKVAILLLSLCFAIASAQQATGFLDSADFNSAAGWACIPSQPFRTLYVQIFVDGRFAGSAAATQSREPAVGQQCGGNSNKGFVFTFPGEFRQILSDGRSHTVRAIVQPFFPFFQRFELNNSPRTVFGGGNFPTPPPDNSALPRGFLDTASATSVAGWACDPDAFNAALRIDLFIDGRFIASTTANQPREPAVGQQCGGNTFHGFTYNWDFNAQNILNDGNPHSVSAFANNFPFGNNFQLSGSPKTVIGNRVFPTFFPPPPGTQPRGFLDTAGTQSASGWACDLDVPNQSLQVQIFANGQFLGTTIANQEREAAVGQQCGGNRFHGWRFNYPFFVSPGSQISAFAINAPTGGSVQLSNSPQSAS